jgi:hypothetical protein
MVMLIGIAIVLALTCAVVGWRRRKPAAARVASSPAQQPPLNRTASSALSAAAAPQRPAVSGEDVANTISGWMLGHEIAHGHTGFPGDPLPGGHLGSASDLAFWGGIFDDDPDDPDF